MKTQCNLKGFVYCQHIGIYYSLESHCLLYSLYLSLGRSILTARGQLIVQAAQRLSGRLQLHVPQGHLLVERLTLDLHEFDTAAMRLQLVDQVLLLCRLPGHLLLQIRQLRVHQKRPIEADLFGSRSAGWPPGRCRRFVRAAAAAATSTVAGAGLSRRHDHVAQTRQIVVDVLRLPKVIVVLAQRLQQLGAKVADEIGAAERVVGVVQFAEQRLEILFAVRAYETETKQMNIHVGRAGAQISMQQKMRALKQEHIFDDEQKNTRDRIELDISAPHRCSACVCVFALDFRQHLCSIARVPLQRRRHTKEPPPHGRSANEAHVNSHGIMLPEGVFKNENNNRTYAVRSLSTCCP